MAENNAMYDVYVAYDHRDSATANAVADVLQSYNLAVFSDTQQISPGTNLEDAIWEAMAESHALVVVIPEDVSSTWLAFELGAAKAWNKPIYAVSAYSSHRNVPPTLRETQVMPISRVNEIAHSIANSSNPLADDDIDCLGNSYSNVGLSVDQLALQPRQLAKLVKQFNKESGRQMAGEQVMWHMLRLRKQRKLPPLKERNLTKH